MPDSALPEAVAAALRMAARGCDSSAGECTQGVTLLADSCRPDHTLACLPGKRSAPSQRGTQQAQRLARASWRLQQRVLALQQQAQRALVLHSLRGDSPPVVWAAAFWAVRLMCLLPQHTCQHILHSRTSCCVCIHSARARGMRGYWHSRQQLVLGPPTCCSAWTTFVM